MRFDKENWQFRYETCRVKESGSLGIHVWKTDHLTFSKVANVHQL